MAHSRSVKLVPTLILFTIIITTSAQNNARPVYEVINEQARIDDIRLSSGPSVLPYGNPLAGNSAQNARLHASNQQAMFNAEKIRQHKAQLQRLTQGPPIIDSYMRAYHESQESHQLALEQQQANIRPDVTSPPTNPRKQIRVRVPQSSKQRTVQNRDSQVRNVQRMSLPTTSQRQEFKSRTSNAEVHKINRANTATKERNRNHRSYDSVEYQQYLESKPRENIPDTAFDEGVTIKPNGNIGLAKEQQQSSSNIQPRAIASSGKYIPKNAHNSRTVQEINALEQLLKKNPNEQLSEFKTLIDSGRSLEKDDSVEAPLDLYYYLKDPSSLHSSKYYDETNTEIPSTFASDHLKDHTPITEEIDDIENPTPYKSTFVTPQLSAETPTLETSTLQTNYYKVEVASQTVSSGFKPSKINEELYLNEDNSSYQTIHYGDQPTRYNKEDELSENSQQKGVQHLTEDGTGVSAYGDENLQYAANYEFGYRVRDAESGNFYGQYEAKKGESTKGHYHVLLPDGRMQKVIYSAGPSGYHADISYDHLQN